MVEEAQERDKGVQTYEILTCSKHVAMNCSTSLRIPGHMKFSLILAMVLVTPICPPTVEKWNSANNVEMKGEVLGSQIRPLCKIKY